MKQVVVTSFFKVGKFLIVKPRKRPKFQIVGCFVEKGEEIMDAAIRECHEKLGISAQFDESKFKFLMDFDEIATSGSNLKIHMNIFVYDGNLTG